MLFGGKKREDKKTTDDDLFPLEDIRFLRAPEEVQIFFDQQKEFKDMMADRMERDQQKWLPMR